MLRAESQRRTGSRVSWFAILAMALLIAGCKSGVVTGAAGDQVDPMGGTGMKPGSIRRDSNGGAGY
jgi:hypothetical protein